MGPITRLTAAKETTIQNKNRPSPGQGFGAIGTRMSGPPQEGHWASSDVACKTRREDAIGQGAEKLRQRCGMGKLVLRVDQDPVERILLAKDCMFLFEDLPYGFIRILPLPSQME